MNVNGSELKFNISTKRGHCDKHGDYEYWSSSLFEIDQCPVCMKEKIETLEKEKAEKEGKAKAEYKDNENHLREMGIEPRFFKADFASFIPEEGEPMHSLQQAALDAMKELVEKKRGIVILMGGHGTRKTTLASAALREFGDGIITNIYEASFLIRAGKIEGVATGYSRLQLLCDAPLVIFDEVGRTNCSDFERNWMSYVTDKRDSRNLATVYISNYPLREIAPQNYKGVLLDDIFGTDILSRFSHAKKLRISGTDFRTINEGGY